MKEFEGTFEEFTALLQSKPAVLAYFSTDECQVCHVLKPQIEKMITSEFPKIETIYLPLNKHPEVAGQFRLFAVPSVVLFMEGKEIIRKSRAFSVHELHQEIKRFYQVLFST